MQMILEKIKSKVSLEFSKFQQSVFEGFQLRELSEALKINKNLKKLGFNIRWPSSLIEFDWAGHEFTNLSNAIKCHPKLKILEI